MTLRQETNVERVLGRLEAQIEAMGETLDRLDTRSGARDSKIEDMSGRLWSVEKKVEMAVAMREEFSALQRALRDGRMQGKGVLMGIALSAGAGGAAAATVFKTLWAWLTGL